MILDEPTASLDPQTEAQIFKDFACLSADKTTILITHRLGSIKMSDTILVLNDGKRVEYGNHYELMGNNSFYKEMYMAQSDQYREKF